MQVDSPSVWETPDTRQFAEVLTTIDKVEAMQCFLRDVMTKKEIIEISSRLEAAKLLQQGNTYADIITKTKLSSRTVARISDWMQNGDGGYSTALQIINTHHGHIPPVRAE